MEKISLSIRIPALDIDHDFIIPSTMSIMDVRQLIVNILVSEYGIKKQVNEISLIDMADGKALRLDASLDQQGVGDGAKLILL